MHKPILTNANQLAQSEVVALYSSVGWDVYTNQPEKLMQALAASSYIFVLRGDDGSLIGLVRGLSDGVSIHYLQDLLVDPNHQGKGCGLMLAQAAIDHNSDVRAHVLLIDDRPEQLAFYAKLGLRNSRELSKTPLNCFVRFRDRELG